MPSINRLLYFITLWYKKIMWLREYIYYMLDKNREEIIVRGNFLIDKVCLFVLIACTRRKMGYRTVDNGIWWADMVALLVTFSTKKTRWSWWCWCMRTFSWVNRITQAYLYEAKITSGGNMQFVQKPTHFMCFIRNGRSCSIFNILFLSVFFCWSYVKMCDKKTLD